MGFKINKLGIDLGKGYIFADIHVHDKDSFEKFKEMTKAVIEKYGAKALVVLLKLKQEKERN